MKTKKIISLILISVMLLAAFPAGTPALARPPQDWAVPEINDANTSGLLTDNAAKDFRRSLTRDEFCELVVLLVEQTLGNPLPVPANNPFVDDVDPISIHALKAWNYGIITGTTATKFSPKSNVQRQQLCAMMIRAIRNLERDLGQSYLIPGAHTLPYRDVARIAEYALGDVKLAYTNDIMQGDTAGLFNPRNDISSQSCVAVIIRTFNRIEAVRTSTMNNSQRLDAAANRVHIGYAYGDTAQGVTRNLTLPLRSSGGATVTWESSNESVISIGGAADGFATGFVDVGSRTRNVTLTATIHIGNSTRTKTFRLTTSLQTGDKLLVDNAHDALEIYYTNPGDSAASVTGRIGLPYTILGLPVTWQSSHPAVVNTSGEVNIPSGNDARTVTLTASFSSGAQSGMKIFTLTVLNPNFSAGVTLHGVQLGMSQSQVTNQLGTVRRTISASNTETWLLYHNTNYSDFIAVAFIGNKAVAVYSMASGAANQLRNSYGAVMTVEQANALTGVSAVSYTDPGSSYAQYAILISDSASVIGASRTLLEDGQEQFLFELVNAFRARHGRNVLAWAPRLGTAARAHSGARGSGNLTQRVTGTGYDSARYSGGSILSGPRDAIDALSQIVESSSGTGAMRTEVLQASLTVFGAGFSGGHSGTYSTYFTYTLGAVTAITGVTARHNNTVVTTISLPVGESAQLPITITIAPTGYNETFTITSSNTNRMTVHNAITTTVPATVTVRGVANGEVNLVVTGNSSGRVHNIPVVVGTAVVTGLSVRHLTTSGNQLGTQSTSTSNSASGTGLYMAIGSSVTVAALTTPAGATNNVNWQVVSGNARLNSGNTTDATSINNAATVNITARSNASAGNTAVIRASIAGASGVTYYVHFNVYLDSQLTLSPISVAFLVAGDSTGTTVTRSGAPNGTVTWAGNRLLFNTVTNQPSVTRITATAGPAITTATTATATARRTGFEGAITANFTVNRIDAGITITTQPQSSTTVNVGGVVSLSVAATAPGTPAPVLTYQWYSNTTNTNTGGSPIGGATGSIYSPPTSTAGTFFYYVEVSSTPTVSVKSNVAQVTVHEQAFALSTNSVNLIPGASTSISVTSDIPSGHTVVWSISSGSVDIIPPSTGSKCTILASSATVPDTAVLTASLMNGSTLVATRPVTVTVAWPTVSNIFVPSQVPAGTPSTLLASVVIPPDVPGYGIQWECTNEQVSFNGNTFTAYCPNGVPRDILISLYLTYTYNDSQVRTLIESFIVTVNP